MRCGWGPYFRRTFEVQAGNSPLQGQSKPPAKLVVLIVKRHRITVQYIHIKLFSQDASSGFIYNLRHNKNISIISKENDGDISPCLFL